MINYSKEQLEEYINAVPFTPYTPLTITSAEALYQKLETVQNCGYAYDPGEFRAGIAGLAAPIFAGSEQPIASISVAELSSIVTPELIDVLSKAVLETARKISTLL